jgi:hypothetical protein
MQSQKIVMPILTILNAYFKHFGTTIVYGRTDTDFEAIIF